MLFPTVVKPKVPLLITLLEPIIELSPITTDGLIIAPAPIKQFFPIVTFPNNFAPGEMTVYDPIQTS